MSSLNILIADDHELFRRSLRSLIESCPGWRVCGEASDGREAIERSRALRPDLVLLDISMPEVNGLEAARYIRKEVPETKIMIVSQNEGESLRRAAMQVGATGFIHKSEIAHDLYKRVEAIAWNSGSRECSASTEGNGKIGPQHMQTEKPAGPELLPGKANKQESSDPSRKRLHDATFEEPMSAAELLARVALRCDADPSRTKATAENSEHEFRFSEILDALPAAIYATDADGRLTYFNPAAVKFSGRTPELGTDQWCVSWKLYHPDGRPMAHDECPMAIALKEGRIIEGAEAIAETPDGTRRWFMPFPMPLRDREGKIIGGINMLLDITDRRESERATNLLAAIVDSSDDAIISKSLDGIITSWNKSAERTFGYTAEEAIGQHITLIVPPELHPEETGILARIRRGERIDHFRTVRVRKDGSRLDLSLTISPVKDASGRIVGASNVSRDITQQKRAEEALRQSEERFRKLSETLDCEVRARTHELEDRNASVLRQSELLRELSRRLLQAQDEERRRIARELHDSAGQTLAVLGMSLATLVRQAGEDAPRLIESVREAEQLVQQLQQEIRTMSYLLHPPLLDEAGLIAALTWYVEGLCSRSGLAITLDVSEDLERLPREMELVIFRIVQESLTNIHRHSGSKTAEIRIARQPNAVTVEIRDEGRGISPAKLSELQSGSSGVGIRGMRERVRQFQGDLQIESKNGTRVVVTIPLPKLKPPAQSSLEPLQVAM